MVRRVPLRAVLLALALVVAAALAALTATSASAQFPSPGGWSSDPWVLAKQRTTLRNYAHDTWHSFEMLTNEETGLSADNVNSSGERAKYTSPTNIASYLWSTLAARDIGVIGNREARQRIAVTLDTLEELERHDESGQFYNWYDPDTGEKLTRWPVGDGPVYPFLSSVDNGWLAAALMMVENAVPQLRHQAGDLSESMDFGIYYDPAAGLLRGGAWVEKPPGCSVEERGVFSTCHHYGTLNSEPRIASYIGIARGQIPATHYFRMARTFPANCDWSWIETIGEGPHRTYLGVDVFEGHYTYRGMNIVPTWGGSMFEALMVPLLVPEEEWGERSWGVNHPLYVQAQIEHGLEEAEYGYWGFSPSNRPEGGYSEYGVDAIGMNPEGYASNNDRTLVNRGFGDCRPAQPDPPASAYTNGVVTPHASFLALDFAPAAVLENLENLRRDFDAYGPGGFYDSVNVDTGEVSDFYLALDQGMIMAALGNELRNDRLQRYFSNDWQVRRYIRPLLEMEEFSAGPAAP